jgi:hypothetical protein
MYRIYVRAFDVFGCWTLGEIDRHVDAYVMFVHVDELDGFGGVE